MRNCHHHQRRTKSELTKPQSYYMDINTTYIFTPRLPKPHPRHPSESIASAPPANQSPSHTKPQRRKLPELKTKLLRAGYKSRQRKSERAVSPTYCLQSRIGRCEDLSISLLPMMEPLGLVASSCALPPEPKTLNLKCKGYSTGARDFYNRRPRQLAFEERREDVEKGYKKRAVYDITNV